jgi:hypothetical protein
VLRRCAHRKIQFTAARELLNDPDGPLEDKKTRRIFGSVGAKERRADPGIG